MTQKIYQLLVVLLFILCAFGWGRLTRRFLDRRIFAFHSLTTIIGLAVLGLIGGVLNLAHVAKAPVLLLMVAIGLGVTTRHLLRSRPWRQRTFPLGAIPLFVAPIFALGAAWLLMPTGVFNIADDFHTYVTRATRMAQTGSLAGNAFDTLGLDSLGSASFFHCFFLLAGGVAFLNGFDAVACFALCVLLLAELSLRWRLPWWLGLCAIFGLAWINPQYVNISPLYAGAAGVMALMVCGLFLARTLMRRHGASAWRLALPMGFLAAWLATMKMTLGFFAGIYLSVLLLVLLVAAANRPAVLKSAGAGFLVLVFGVLPWALVPLPALLRARNAAETLITSAPLAEKYTSLTAHQSAFLFNPIALFYGDTPVFYLAVSGAAFALGIAGVAHWLRRRSDSKLHGTLAVAAGGVAMFATLFLNSHLFPIGMAIRYTCPIVIGGAFVVALGFVRSRTPALAPSRRWVSAGLAAGCVALIISFNETFLERLDTARQNRTLLAYSVNQSYIDYSRDMLTDAAAGYHSRLQNNIPSGSTALVWTTTPFHFDFERNQLLTMTAPAMTNPALHFPAGLAPGGLEQYLRNNRVRFVIMETNGYGLVDLEDLVRIQRSRLAVYKKIGDFGTYLRRSLDELATRGKVLYSDGRMVVFELGNSTEPLDQKVSTHTISSL